MNIRKSYILSQDFAKRYYNEYMNYYIDLLYPGTIRAKDLQKDAIE